MSRPACAHSKVEHVQIKNIDQTLSDAWQCEDCGREFEPVMAPLRAHVLEMLSEAQKRIAELEAENERLRQALDAAEAIEGDLCAFTSNAGWCPAEKRVKALEAEVKRLRDLIVTFCKAHAWSVATWKQQGHIAPLFAVAEAAGEAREVPVQGEEGRSGLADAR